MLEVPRNGQTLRLREATHPLGCLLQDDDKQRIRSMSLCHLLASNSRSTAFQWTVRPRCFTAAPSSLRVSLTSRAPCPRTAWRPMSVCLQFFVRRAWLQVYQAGRGQGNRGSVPELFAVTSCLPHIIVSMDNNTNHNGLGRHNNGDVAQPGKGGNGLLFKGVPTPVQLQRDKHNPACRLGAAR